MLSIIRLIIRPLLFLRRCPFEEMADECSDVEDIIVNTPKRKPKSVVRLSLSGPKKRGKSKANPAMKKGVKEGDQGIHGPFAKTKIFKGKKKKKGLMWNCRGIKKKGVSSFL